ncbi:P-loop containing nucleoside triphosphate hydrolase protein [Parasitella parasitica]|nr:P-loop containing nucleoside triphosphate hydrolase protein [Parasitella parasitica]
MPAITPAQLSSLQHNTKNIRNICILAHVDHGKTTLSDSLLATNGIISSKMAGKVRYLDSREDEQERGITMESSAISLYFKLVKSVVNEGSQAQPKTVESEYLINLIDSPGHVDFSSEVSTASRLCDGGLVLIDVVEGVCTQTVSVLRQAWIDKVRPVLVFNKMDRLIVELQMTPNEAYIHINKILEQVNAVMATFFTGDLMESEARKMTDEKKDVQEDEEEFDANKVYDWSVEDRDDSDIYFDPAKGNVIFSSAVDGWAFRVQQFASFYAKKIGFKESVLQKCLWGEYYFDPKAKRVILPKHLKGRNLKPMFVQFVLENIWAVYGSVVIEPDRERVEKIVGALKIKVLPRDLRSRDPQILLSAIFSQWLPLSTCVLLAIIGQLPPPADAQRVRLPKMLYPNIHRKDSDPLQPINDVEKALYSCDTSPDAPVVAYVSKMFAVPVEFLPENRRTQMSAEEMRERGRQQRELRAAQAALDKSGEGIPLTSEQVETLADEPQAEEAEPFTKELKGESLIGFARLYSGSIRVGQKLYVMGPKYDPKFPKKHISEIMVQSLYLIMGRDLESLQEVCAGNVFGIGGLEGRILKNGTLASTVDNVRNMAGVKMESSPIVRVALEPQDPTQMDKLVQGLHLLNQADPCVEVMLQETGEHVILTAGELHLERCLRDLKERFAKIEIHASEPIVPFRESIVRAELPAGKEKEGVVVPRGQAEIKISSKFLTLKVQTVPLPVNVTDFLTKHAASIKAVVEEKLAKKSTREEEEDEDTGDAAPVTTNQLLSASELEQSLKQEFADAKKDGGPSASIWDNAVDQIWAFGPRRIGSSLLINRIPGYVRKPFFQMDSKRSADVAVDHADEVLEVLDEDTSALSILDIDFHIHTAFQLSTLTGPLCAEPMTGVCFIVQGVEFHPEEMVSSNGEAVDVRARLPIIQGHVIAAAREAYRQGFLDWSPRLLLAMYTCDIQANAEVLGRVYGVISKRKGKIVSEDLKDGTSFWQINALLPVIESFGFSDEIRKRTSGAASPQLVFSGFEMLDEDPFWVPTTEEELEDLGEKADKENLAKKYMDTVRKRKGMFVEKKLVEHAEKQRTLRKN